VPDEVIAGWSSKCHRVTMATLLTRKGVPLPEVQAMGDWDSPEMCERYIRSLDALAPEQRNYSNVMYGGYAAQEPSSSVEEPSTSVMVRSPRDGLADEPGSEPSLDGLFESLPELFTSFMESSEASLELTLSTATGETASAAEQSGAAALASQQRKRSAECDPQYDACCDKPFKKRARNPLAGKPFKKNIVLQGLLAVHAGLKPGPLQSVLCGHDFHTTRREITNFRARKKE
jgi:hypothetical protein